jgi:glutamine amidotransferase
MCRHLAWLGAPRSVASLVLDPPQGLLTQSYAPRRQKYGRVNADGWGVGVVAADGPHRWRSTRPLWSDASFASIAPLLSSTCIVAAVRSATTGMPIEEGATAPFTDGRWLLSHNGRVARDVLPADAVAESVCDSALLAAHVFATGVPSLGELVRGVAAKDPGARLNLLLADGSQILATTWGDTLSYRVFDDGVAVVSEPWDDEAGWLDVPDRHLLSVTPTGVTLTGLETP